MGCNGEKEALPYTVYGPVRVRAMARPGTGRAMPRLPGGDLHHEVMRVGKIEERARPLVEHIRIDAAGFEQRNPSLPACPLVLEFRKLHVQFGDLLVEILLGEQPVVARI